MMEASHFRDLDHPSKYRRLDRSRFRRIFIQCQMRARMQIVLKIRFQNPTERTFVEHHNVIEAFAAYGADGRSSYGFCQGDRGAVSTS